MPTGPENYVRRPKGRPPKHPEINAEAAIREVRDDPIASKNPILFLSLAAKAAHKKREFARVSAYLDAVELLASACVAAVQQDLFADPMATCDCGHSFASHVTDGYCVTCLYKINGLGFHGCKGFRQPQRSTAPDSRRCTCGRFWMSWPTMTEKDYPRTHNKPPRPCFETRPEGLNGRTLRFTLDPLPELTDKPNTNPREDDHDPTQN